MTAWANCSRRGDCSLPVYDDDAARLLHSFFARAAAPCFQDATDASGLDAQIGHLELQWPEPLARIILKACDPGLGVVAG